MAAEEKLEEYRALARARLSDKRYEHTLAVARLAGELAEKYGIDVEKARTAGLLHDITKEVPIDIQLQMIEKSAILVDKTLLLNPNVYHALTAFLFVKDRLSVTDTDTLNAIRFHTTGRAGMSLLEKIVYTADAVSYERSYPEVERLREQAFSDLDGCMLEILEFTLKKLVSAQTPIAADTLHCYNELCPKRR